MDRRSTVSLALRALFSYLIRYRRTVLGPVWLLVAPSLFIALLGNLYAHVGGIHTSEFIPHLAVGVVTWALIGGFVTSSTTVFQRARANILQGGQTLDDIVMVDVMTTTLNFLHQVIIIIVVFVIYEVPFTLYSLVSVIGVALIVANGIWISHVFGILGARYRDLSEIVQAVMRIAFLATPIIWSPGAGVRGGVMGHFLVFNPFYHFLELVRAPLLGQPIAPLSWAVAISITVLGFALAHYSTTRLARYVPLWV